jgi:hypothetical protein
VVESGYLYHPCGIALGSVHGPQDPIASEGLLPNHPMQWTRDDAQRDKSELIPQMRLLIVLLGSFACVPCPGGQPRPVDGDRHGKHLFILSGQSNMVGLDPDLSFTPGVAEAFGQDNVIVVKDAHGGQSIRSWAKTNHEFPPPTQGRVPQVRGNLYPLLINKARAVIEGEKIQTITFVWMQGESDLNNTAYDAYLDELYSQLQTDLRFQDINFVIGRISDAGLDVPKRLEGRRSIRQTQVDYAEDHPNGAWVNTDDLNDRVQDGTKVHDLHYTPAGYKTLGQRFAKAAIELIKRQDRQ